MKNYSLCLAVIGECNKFSVDSEETMFSLLLWSVSGDDLWTYRACMQHPLRSFGVLLKSAEFAAYLGGGQ